MNSRLPAWARRVVLSGMCGSHVHGTYIEPTEQHGTDDVDVFQVIAHPRAHYLGMGYYRRQHESYQTHGESLDIVVHEVAKFVALCAQGNPNVNSYLWLEPTEYFSITAAGEMLLARRETFVSRRMFAALGGYAYAQLKKMTAGERLGYMGAKRKTIMAQYGYDIKNAAHCIRLFMTGIMLARTGQLLVKLSGHNLATVMAVKQGQWTVQAVERLATELDAEMRAATRSSTIRAEPDAKAVDAVLRDALEAQWETMQGTTE